MECELLRSPMISYRSLLYNTTVLYDTSTNVCTCMCTHIAISPNHIVHSSTNLHMLYVIMYIVHSDMHTIFIQFLKNAIS